MYQNCKSHLFKQMLNNQFNHIKIKEQVLSIFICSSGNIQLLYKNLEHD